MGGFAADGLALFRCLKQAAVSAAVTHLEAFGGDNCVSIGIRGLVGSRSVLAIGRGAVNCCNLKHLGKLLQQLLDHLFLTFQGGPCAREKQCQLMEIFGSNGAFSTTAQAHTRAGWEQ